MKRVYKNENGVISNVRYEDDDYKCQKNEKELAYSDDLMGGIVNVNSSSIAEQYAAIDEHILTKIKTKGYDSLGSVALAGLGGDYQVEALRINDWVHAVWAIQDNLESAKFDSVESAIAALPPFEILA